MLLVIMATDTENTHRENVILTALDSISRVLGRQDEYQNFVSYVN
jgi:hypothetical protein